MLWPAIEGGVGCGARSAQVLLSARPLGVRCLLRGKESFLTDTTLTRVLERTPARVPATGTVRLVVRWDRETGWAHLAIAVPDAARPRFVGFHRFTDGAADAVLAELAAAGCVTASTPRHDDDLMELDAVLARREVAANAVR